MHLIQTSVVEHLHSSQARRCCPDQGIVFLSLVDREVSSPLILATVLNLFNMSNIHHCSRNIYCWVY